MRHHYSDRIPLTESQTLGQARAEIEAFNPTNQESRDLQTTARNIVNLLHALLDYKDENGYGRAHPMAVLAVQEEAHEFLSMPVVEFPIEDLHEEK